MQESCCCTYSIPLLAAPGKEGGGIRKIHNIILIQMYLASRSRGKTYSAKCYCTLKQHRYSICTISQSLKLLGSDVRAQGWQKVFGFATGRVGKPNSRRLKYPTRREGRDCRCRPTRPSLFSSPTDS